MSDHSDLLAACAEGRLPEISPEEVCKLGEIVIEGWVPSLPPHLLTGSAIRVERLARHHLRVALTELGLDAEGYRLHLSAGTGRKLFDVRVVVLSAIDRLAALADARRTN